MQRLVASPLALRALIALRQASGGLRISEVALIIEAAASSTDRALEILAEERLADRKGSRYAVHGSTKTDIVLRFAIAMLDPSESVGVIARANPSVEFAGVDAAGFLVVVRRFADGADEANLISSIADLRLATDSVVEVVDKSSLRDRLLVDPQPRMRAIRMRVLAGSVDRTFPDRTRHGDPSSPPLGELHPSLPKASQRRLRDIAHRYHLQRIVAFGSATREDFRAGSDVDVLVEPRVGHRTRIGDVVRLNSELELLFGRDVDLLAGPVTEQRLRSRIERDAVVLYDAP